MTELPAGWTRAKFSDFGTWVGGGTPSKAVSAYWGGPIPWVSPKDMKTKIIRSAIDGITADAVEKSAARIIPAGSVLIVTRSGILAHTLPIAITAVETTLNQDLKALTLSDGIDPEFIAMGLHAFEQSILNDCRKGGTTVHSIEMPSLNAFELPIPPTNEQRRIVEKIEAMFERIDKGVESLRAAKTTLALYRQSLLKSAFEGRLTADWRAQNADSLEDPKTLLARIQEERDTRYKTALDTWQTALAEWRDGGEKGKKPAKPKRQKDIAPQHITLDALPDITSEWGNLRLGELNVTVSDGPFGSNLKTSDYTASGVQVIRLENIGYGQFLAEKQSFISQEKYKTISHHTVYPGTIVVSSFVTDAVRSCLVPDSVPYAINKADCFAVVLDGAQSSRQFLAYYLQSPQVFKQLEGLIHGVGRPRINTTQLKEVHYPICSSAEQAEITRILDARLDAADKMDAEIDATLIRAEALRQSILKQAFAGKLVPQDPTDEPAPTLLARIKAERAKAGKNKQRRTAHA
ncbi:restriction endonuclease subunit S [Roseovarius mucosus]|uniref:restriction endonuclease subunit S n=1 Tax=Roseovarius mucosus TaxID=215743 RepID=UPI003BAA0038